MRDASGFPMTFICTNTDSGASYMPSKDACTRGGYEVYNCSFVPGTGEICAEKMAELLRQTRE